MKLFGLIIYILALIGLAIVFPPLWLVYLGVTGYNLYAKY